MTKKSETSTEAIATSTTPRRKAKSSKERSTKNRSSYERIQVAALNLFAESGVESTSIRDIGARAKVPTSLLYHYARSKFRLVFEIMFEGMQRYHGSALEARSLGTTPEERLVALVSAHIIMHCRNRQFAKVIEHGWRPLPKKEKEIMLRVRDAYSQLWDEVLLEGSEAHVFDIKEPRLARLGIVQMCSVSTWYSSGGPLTVEDLVQHFGELVFGIVRASRNGKPLRFAQVKKPEFAAVMAIVERHHQGVVFAGKI